MDSGSQLDNSLLGRVQHLHESYFGHDAGSIEPLTSHGSDRIILRMRSPQGKTSIGIVNQHLGENRAFIAFADHFRRHGLRVPEVYIKSDDDLSYLMQDLGDITLLKKIYSEDNEFGENESSLYKKVIEILPEFQVNAGNTIDYSYCYQYKEFAEENIRHDIRYFNEQFIKNFFKGTIDTGKLQKEFDLLVKKLLEVERESFMYRDFQSRNIMLNGDGFYFIDFQSGRRGALLYDIASLLYDARAKIPQEHREKLIEYYLDVLSNYKKVDRNKYAGYFWFFALIRILQAMGAYGFLGITKSKKRFLESVPLALNNAGFILDNRLDNFPYLKKIFGEIKT